MIPRIASPTTNRILLLICSESTNDLLNLHGLDTCNLVICTLVRPPVTLLLIRQSNPLCRVYRRNTLDPPHLPWAVSLESPEPNESNFCAPSIQTSFSLFMGEILPAYSQVSTSLLFPSSFYCSFAGGAICRIRTQTTFVGFGLLRPCLHRCKLLFED